MLSNLFPPANPDDKPYVRTHVSFQSTGATNISSVNAISQCHLSVRQKSRGSEPHKRVYGLEMNEARATYLGTYSAVDSVDHLIRNVGLLYCLWKWWHAPMRLAKSLAMVQAYFMYLECAEGNLDPSWKLEDPVGFKEFRFRAGTQMCQYKTSNCDYAGDQLMRGATVRVKRRRGRRAKYDEVEAPEGRVTLEGYMSEKYPQSRSTSSRFTNEDLSLFKEHVASIECIKWKHVCVVCGKDCHFKCGKCDKHMCFKKGSKLNTMSCIIDHHNDCFFGLGRDDFELVGQCKGKWKYPNKRQLKNNADWICKLRERAFHARSMLD